MDVHSRGGIDGDGSVGVPAIPGCRLVGEGDALCGDLPSVGRLLHPHECALRLSFRGDHRRQLGEDFALDVAVDRRGGGRRREHAPPPSPLR